MRRSAGFTAVAALGLGLGLGGCAATDVVIDQPPPGYVEDAAARVAAVDWSGAQVVTVVLSEFAFEPDQLEFREGVPYRLVLRNTGLSRHSFVSEGFFQAIAAHKLALPEGEVAAPYVQSIEIAPGATKELEFVAVRTGIYALGCTELLHDAFGMDGAIVVR